MSTITTDRVCIAIEADERDIFRQNIGWLISGIGDMSIEEPSSRDEAERYLDRLKTYTDVREALGWDDEPRGEAVVPMTRYLRDELDKTRRDQTDEIGYELTSRERAAAGWTGAWYADEPKMAHGTSIEEHYNAWIAARDENVARHDEQIANVRREVQILEAIVARYDAAAS